MNKIIDNLFVGDMNDGRMAKMYGAMEVISVMGEREPGRSLQNFDILNLRKVIDAGIVEDLPATPGNGVLFAVDMSKVDETCKLAHKYLNEGKQVLVHCAYGMERSPMTCMRYLMLYKGFNLLAARKHVEDRRPETIFHPEWWPETMIREHWSGAFQATAPKHIEGKLVEKEDIF